VGRGPTKELPLRSRYVRAVRVESVEGRLPVKRFVTIDSIDNFVKLPKYEGIGPINELLPRSRLTRLVRVGRDDGRLPVKRFVARDTPLRRVGRFEGRLPVKRLPQRYRLDNLVNPPT
jgi:hypothetical protein